MTHAYFYRMNYYTDRADVVKFCDLHKTFGDFNPVLVKTIADLAHEMEDVDDMCPDCEAYIRRYYVPQQLSLFNA